MIKYFRLEKHRDKKNYICVDLSTNKRVKFPFILTKYKKDSLFNNNKIIKLENNKYKIISNEEYMKLTHPNEEYMKLTHPNEEYMKLTHPNEEVVTICDHISTTNDEINFIHNSYKLKPDDVFISELKWKHLVRSVIRGKNILILGPTGSGKTLLSKTVSKILNKPFFYFNLGSSQDPRTFLIGNTQYKKETGTVFNESAFIKAIKTKNSVILLDEISRAHPDAWNILMTVLDETQKYVRLDEKENSEIVFVESGVTFIATANIGSEYTSTRTLDKALFDRFVILEMDLLNKNQEFLLLKKIYPTVDDKLLSNIAEIVAHTRECVKTEGAKITNTLSTRQSVLMGELAKDGFSLLEIAEVLIYPSYADDGIDSERTYMKQFLQKFLNVTDKTTKDLFNLNEPSPF